MITLLNEPLDHDYRVRLTAWPINERPIYKIELYHPASDWVHRYGCGSLRKALTMIDVTIPAEIALEARQKAQESDNNT